VQSTPQKQTDETRGKGGTHQEAGPQPKYKQVVVPRDKWRGAGGSQDLASLEQPLINHPCNRGGSMATIIQQNKREELTRVWATLENVRCSSPAFKQADKKNRGNVAKLKTRVKETNSLQHKYSMQKGRCGILQGKAE
jgi:hypothetical protein